MNTITVTTQTELDTALEEHGDDDTTTIIISSPRGVWLTLSKCGTATVRAYGTATVWAYGTATVEAYGTATVEAYGTATVRAYGTATVEACGTATVWAYGTATVRAYGTATVRASSCVAVHLFSSRVTHEGGVIIDVTALDRSHPITWAQYWGVTITPAGHDEEGDARLTVYKAVDDSLKSGRGFSYPIGETVVCPDWAADGECGHGLHLSPRPRQARAYLTGATRYLKCQVDVADVQIIDGNGTSTPKLKARAVRVIREVDADGRPVNA